MATKDVQTTNKQHAIPQNVLDVQFKIISGLTMRQFFYLLINGVIVYITFLAVGNTYLKVLIMGFFALFGVFLAYIPLNERGLDEWIVFFFKAVYRNNQRVWKKEIVVPTAFNYQNLNVVKQEMVTLAPTTSRRKLEEYLDSYGKNVAVDPLDINTKKYDDLLKETYAPKPVYTEPTQNLQQSPDMKQPMADQPQNTNTSIGSNASNIQNQTTTTQYKPPVNDYVDKPFTVESLMNDDPSQNNVQPASDDKREVSSSNINTNGGSQ